MRKMQRMKIVYEITRRRPFGVGYRVQFYPRAVHRIVSLGFVEIRRITINEPSDVQRLCAAINAALGLHREPDAFDTIRHRINAQNRLTAGRVTMRGGL